MVKAGQQYLDSLRDGRQVFLDGELATDVVDHPAYRNAIRTTAGLYDFQAAPENVDTMTFESPTSGDRVNLCWQLPGSYDELVARRKAMEAWAECTYGYMGRSPDHVASSLAGMMMRLDLFEAHGEERARALAEYYRYVRDNDLFVTYTITNPQGWTGEHDEFLVAGICDEDSTGVTIKGAKTLGTSSILANEVLCTTIQPLTPGAEKHAFSVAVPMNAPGLKILSRKSYEAWAASEFDNPLSFSLDENDAVLYFDEVKVPWDRVFINRDIKLCRDQFHEAPTHIFQNYQSQVRVMVKLRFLVGLARKMADANDLTRVPQVVETLGRLAAQAGVIEGMVNGMEVQGRYVGPYYVPDRHPLYTAQVMAQELYPQIIEYAARPGWRQPDHAALVGKGLWQPGSRRLYRTQPERHWAGDRGTGQAVQAGLGRHRLRVRLPPHPVRAVLRRRGLRRAQQLLPHLRLGARHRHGRRPAGQLRPAAVTGAYPQGPWSNCTRMPSGS